MSTTLLNSSSVCVDAPLVACSFLCPFHVHLPALQAKASYGVKPGDVVCCSVLPPPPLEAAPEPLPLDIVYEDAHLLVINKVRIACNCHCKSCMRMHLLAINKVGFGLGLGVVTCCWMLQADKLLVIDRVSSQQVLLSSVLQCASTC